MYLSSVQKSLTFGEDNNGTTRYIIVCAYRDGSNSRLSRGRLSNNTDFITNADLQAIYPPTPQMGDGWENYEPDEFYITDKRTGKKSFDADKAFDDYVANFLGATDDDLKGVTVPISEIDENGVEAYEVAATGNVKKSYHFAVDKDEPYEVTKESARNALRRHLDYGVLVEIDDKK